MILSEYILKTPALKILLFTAIFLLQTEGRSCTCPPTSLSLEETNKYELIFKGRIDSVKDCGPGFGEAFFNRRKEYLRRCIAGETVRFDIELDDPYRIVESIYIPDRKDQRVVGFYLLTTDVTTMRQHAAQLSAMARVDPLTGLWNRRSYEEKLREAVARGTRSGHPIGLLFLDVDYFKRINDSLGHAGGDAVLKEFASRLKASVRATDSVFRLAGDEFTVILENVKTSADVELVAQKIVEVIRVPFLVLGGEFGVTTSVGAVFARLSLATQIEALNQVADEALYAAKGAGRNGYVFQQAENKAKSEQQ